MKSKGAKNGGSRKSEGRSQKKRDQNGTKKDKNYAKKSGWRLNSTNNPRQRSEELTEFLRRTEKGEKPIYGQRGKHADQGGNNEEVKEEGELEEGRISVMQIRPGQEIKNMTVEEYKAKFLSLSREPFHDPLAKLLANAPSDMTIKTLAQSDPLGWSRMVAIMAKIAGYADKSETQSSVFHKFLVMSDQELEASIKESAKIIHEGEFREVEGT